MQTYFVTTAFTAQSMTSGVDTTNNGSSENGDCEDGAVVSLEEIEEQDDGEELDELEDRLASKFCPTNSKL